MFNKKRIDKLEELIRLINLDIEGRHGCIWFSRVIGIKQQVSNLERENKKLKAIVAELCDYVYADKKQTKQGDIK